MQKCNVQLLSTAPLSSELINEAAVQNIIIDQVSFIDIQFINEKDVSSIIDNYLQQNITAIFTSNNAVNAIARHVKQKPVWKIFCIGNTTKKLLYDIFGAENIAGTAANAGELADVIVKSKIGHAVFFCGDHRRDELPAKLKQHGIITEEIVVYNTIKKPVKIDKKYDGIMFFSPSAADSFFSVNNIEKETQLFAIGTTTAKAIQQYSKNNVVLSASPGKKNLIKQVIKFYKEGLQDKKL